MQSQQRALLTPEAPAKPSWMEPHLCRVLSLNWKLSCGFYSLFGYLTMLAASRWYVWSCCHLLCCKFGLFICCKLCGTLLGIKYPENPYVVVLADALYVENQTRSYIMCLFQSKWITVPSQVEGVKCSQLGIKCLVGFSGKWGSVLVDFTFCSPWVAKSWWVGVHPTGTAVAAS